VVLLLELACEQLHLSVEFPALERPRHLDDQLFRLRFFDAAQDVDAVVFPHPQIGDDHVVGAGGSVLPTLLAARGLVDLVACAAQHHGQRGPHVALVVDD
jgi:hypothetical protein